MWHSAHNTRRSFATLPKTYPSSWTQWRISMMWCNANFRRSFTAFRMTYVFSDVCPRRGLGYSGWRTVRSRWHTVRSRWRTEGWWPITLIQATKKKLVLNLYHFHHPSPLAPPYGYSQKMKSPTVLWLWFALIRSQPNRLFLLESSFDHTVL